MSNIITKSDFTTTIKIANKSDVAVMEDLNGFITELEPQFLNMLFGDDFATLFVNGIIPPVTDPVTPQDPRMVALLTPQLRKAIATYIYYGYMRDNYEQATGVGVVQTANQNAVLASPRNKMLSTWFEMVKTVWGVQKTLADDNGVVYPEWVVPDWYSAFAQMWYVWNWSVDIFSSAYYYGFNSSYYCIPDIYYPLSRL